MGKRPRHERGVRGRRLFGDRERPLKHLARGLVLTGKRQENGEIVHAASELDVIGSECLLADRKGALEERARLGIVAHVAMENPEVTQRVSHIGMVRYHLLSNGEPTFEKRKRTGIIAGEIEELPQGGERPSRIFVLRPERLLSDRE